MDIRKLLQKPWEKITTGYVNFKMPVCYTTGDCKSGAHFRGSGGLSVLEKRFLNVLYIDVI